MSGKESRQGSAELDEPTAEMMAAGIKAFFAYDRRFEEPGDCVRRIWLEMSIARSGRQRQDYSS
jgi:hypothetical protein